MYRVHQAEYVIHIRVAASQEYVNTYSTRRHISRYGGCCFPRPLITTDIFLRMVVCGVVLVVSCAVLFLLCVCVCDLFLFSQLTL